VSDAHHKGPPQPLEVAVSDSILWKLDRPSSTTPIGSASTSAQFKA
jgi:hypothetical protein